MLSSLNILMAQTNPYIGDIDANCEKIIKIITEHKHTHDLIIFPELALSGYLLEDLLLRSELFGKIDNALDKISKVCDNSCHVIIGHPKQIGNQTYNHASIFANSCEQISYSKQKLPNYGVFDEKRYFNQGLKKPPIFSLKDWQIKLCICEDLWQNKPVDLCTPEPFDILVAINASPFEVSKHRRRINLCKQYAKQGINLIYVNQVGGQDEIVFDGASFALDCTGKIIAQAPEFIENCQSIKFTKQQAISAISPKLNSYAAIYQAIVLGLKDYVHKSGFQKVILGLSGGIDSALCLAIAVDAFGPSKVTAVLLPSAYTADISNHDAEQMARNLGVKNFKIAIHDHYESLLNTIQQLTINPQDLTKQNLQARIRGIILMALSNDTNSMLICTSNKSETAVGYGTLYGDMIGGYAPIKDLFKTTVYKLANHRNKLSPVIPERIITRAPSAELAPNQKDEDTLPQYPILDPILKLYIEKNLSPEQIASRGYCPDIISDVVRLINNSEYKRKQSPLGPKVSHRSFGKDWRYSLT